jgi:hypothetical protein
MGVLDVNHASCVHFPQFITISQVEIGIPDPITKGHLEEFFRVASRGVPVDPERLHLSML